MQNEQEFNHGHVPQDVANRHGRIIDRAANDDNSSIAAKEWRAYVEPRLPISERLIPQINEAEDPQLRQEIYKAAFSALAGGYPALLNGDPDHPDLVPFTGQFLNLLGPNLDFMYYLAPIDGSNFGTTHSNYYLDDLHLDADGAFEVILSRTRPAAYTGDWWELKPDSTNVVLRQLSYDWLCEIDARLAIEPRWTRAKAATHSRADRWPAQAARGLDRELGGPEQPFLQDVRREGGETRCTSSTSPPTAPSTSQSRTKVRSATRHSPLRRAKRSR